MNVSPIKALIFMKKYSERVPGKNMKLLHGRPLFHWIMDSLSKSKYIKEIIINTDSEEIADNAKRNFDVTLHMRPDYLLNITSNEADQIIEYDLSQTDGEFFLQSHSTTPLLLPGTIDHTIETYFRQNHYDSIISVTLLRKRFYWPNGTPINHDPNNLIRTQELAPIYEENSCIYFFSRTIFNARKSRIGYRPLMYPVSILESVDIDEADDFELAEALLECRSRKNNLLSM